MGSNDPPCLLAQRLDQMGYLQTLVSPLRRTPPPTDQTSLQPSRHHHERERKNENKRRSCTSNRIPPFLVHCP